MTQQPTAQLSAADVADFLQQHPLFFEEHPELFANIQWVSPASGQTISFADRQIIHLRDKLTALEKKMLELIEFGTENDSLLTKYHTMAIRLIRAKTLSSVFEVVYETIRNEFSLPHAAIRLWPDEPGFQVGPEFESVSDAQRQLIEQQPVPYIGPLAALSHHEDFAKWFWVPIEQVGSVALLALRDGDKTIGAILIGSPDAAKFTQQMGTMFLEQMTDQIAAAIVKNQS